MRNWPLRRKGGCLLIQIQHRLSDIFYQIDGKKGLILFQGVHAISTWDVHTYKNPLQSMLVVGKSSLSNPTEIYSVEHSQSCQLSQHGSAIAKLQIGDSRPLDCKADEGAFLDAVLYTSSKHTTRTPFPAVVLVHGGPYDLVSVSFKGAAYFNWTPWLVSVGYAVFCPNSLGSSSRGGAFAAAARGAVGTKDYEDIISLVKAGIAEGTVDEQRVGIGGWSQGGFLSYLATTRPNTFHFEAAVCGAGVTDWDTICMTLVADWFGPKLLGSAPWKGDIASITARQASPFWHTKDVRDTPILILHEKEDVRTPMSQATAFH